MGFVEGHCDHCDALNREFCDAWAHGSPIRICQKCGREYLDPQWQELALEGEPKKKSAGAYLLFMFFFLAGAALCGWWVWNSIQIKGSYSIRMAGATVVCIIGALLCFVLFIRIVTGIEGKQMKKAYEESVERLQNKDYVAKLIKYGYNVPDEFKN